VIDHIARDLGEVYTKFIFAPFGAHALPSFFTSFRRTWVLALGAAVGIGFAFLIEISGHPSWAVLLLIVAAIGPSLLTSFFPDRLAIIGNVPAIEGITGPTSPISRHCCRRTACVPWPAARRHVVQRLLACTSLTAKGARVHFLQADRQRRQPMRRPNPMHPMRSGSSNSVQKRIVGDRQR
jgi:hypothetical protein